VVLEMLARLLEPEGCTVEIAPAGGLVSEMMPTVEASRPSLICLGALEGSAPATSSSVSVSPSPTSPSWSDAGGSTAPSHGGSSARRAPTTW
jgi:hypothetical protein